MATIDGDISRLPEGCIAHILSLTSPSDSCSSAAVSTTFRSAADSDIVWDRFLPPDHFEIISLAVQPPTFSSKKELYFRLCDPILINGGKMSFQLERSSGKKCFQISARELVVACRNTPLYRKWIPSSDSRFPEAALLVDACELEIRGKIDTRVLSPKTTYCACLVYKIALGMEYGLSYPAEASVKVGTYVSERRVYITLDGQYSNAYHPRHPGMVFWRSNLVCLTLNERHSDAYPRHPGMVSRRYNLPRRPRFLLSNATERREDWWVKLEMGEFFIDEGVEGEVDISLMEVDGFHMNRGLIIQGIEVMPKNQTKQIGWETSA